VRVHVREGGALLLTTHQLEEADALADRLVLLEHGRVVADGLVAHLKAAAGLTVVRFRAPPDTDVEGAEREGPYVRILTPDGGVEVERLVRRGVSLVDLEVRPLTLEEALSARSRGA
jgi:ABC-2 type transport system ATP-binding protein